MTVKNLKNSINIQQTIQITIIKPKIITIDIFINKRNKLKEEIDIIINIDVFLDKDAIK